jgi:hypothetical protein
MKTEFKPIGKAVYLKAVGTSQTKSGIVVDFKPQGKPANQRFLQIDYIKVLAVGNEVETLKEGDLVIPKGHVFNNRLPEKNLNIEQDENIQYYWANEEDIIGVIINTK